MKQQLRKQLAPLTDGVSWGKENIKSTGSNSKVQRVTFNVIYWQLWNIICITTALHQLSRKKDVVEEEVGCDIEEEEVFASGY